MSKTTRYTVLGVVVILGIIAFDKANANSTITLHKDHVWQIQEGWSPYRQLFYGKSSSFTVQNNKPNTDRYNVIHINSGRRVSRVILGTRYDAAGILIPDLIGTVSSSAQTPTLTSQSVSDGKSITFTVECK